MKHEMLLGALLPMTALVAPAYSADYLTVEQAQRQFFPNASQFVDSTLDLDDDQRDQIKERAGTRQRRDNQRVWRAEQEGKNLGWMFVDDVIGKHEFITYALAVSPAGEVLGVEILSYRETHGGEVREASWRDQFNGKTLDDTIRLGKDVSNISGATLSCRNVTDGVRRLLNIWDLYLKHA
ncbi:FMN-binding protein [Microbulbifer hainanensis]|uniref:FMN-binding protein n=1 Tax=Microbulbifer hainanensis TaxID=2735675 RepID=UPI001868B047|nr:FMN-binding protein [Microbulbifer hainanensis]